MRNVILHYKKKDPCLRRRLFEALSGLDLLRSCELPTVFLYTFVVLVARQVAHNQVLSHKSGNQHWCLMWGSQRKVIVPGLYDCRNMTDLICFPCPGSPVTQEKGRHKGLGKHHSLSPPPSFLNIKNLCFSRAFLHRCWNKTGMFSYTHTRKITWRWFSIKLLTLKCDVVVIDGVALSAVRMWFFNHTLKIKTNWGQQLCICLWVGLQKQYFSNYISSVLPNMREDIINPLRRVWENNPLLFEIFHWVCFKAILNVTLLERNEEPDVGCIQRYRKRYMDFYGHNQEHRKWQRVQHIDIEVDYMKWNDNQIRCYFNRIISVIKMQVAAIGEATIWLYFPPQ